MLGGLRLNSGSMASEMAAARECFSEAHGTDVRPLILAWRRARGLPEDPLQTLAG
ncbi:MAG TPA: hypothetical protein VM120_11115 [Bryobacteraceae bacterium]|nr:hypothetical protein [Bryobacteraceae bacterium]